MSENAPAGWYPNQAGDGMRYWDGVAWTEHTHVAAPAVAPLVRKRWVARHPVWTSVFGVFAFVIVMGIIGAAIGGSGGTTPTASTSSVSPSAEPSPTSTPTHVPTAAERHQAYLAAVAQQKAAAHQAYLDSLAAQKQAAQQAAAAQEAADHPTDNGLKLISWTYHTEDFSGSCTGTARVQNVTDSTIDYPHITITLLDGPGGSPVATLNGIADHAAPGQTVTVTLLTNDTCPGKSYAWDYQAS